MLKFAAPFFALFLQTFLSVHAQIDVLHYRYQLTLSDASDSLTGTAMVTAKFLENTNRFFLNLASVKQGNGMQVLHVKTNDTAFSFTHVHDTLYIASPQAFQKDSVQSFWIVYRGIPADGLIISKNKYNDRTFFADNWPNRAHHWIPCNDRPDDKATVEFEVTAPAHYKVISNGVLLDEKPLSNNQTRTHWKEETPIPTKVMVIGAARFAVKHFTDSSVTPVSAWVYPQDSTKGFHDYGLAPSIVTFFSAYIGPYPFSKLANVQSKTIFGGMENASAIFYGENTVTGNRKSEALLAHEIAHQWFGNSATEKSFAHLWLSEGFATYMTLVYLEQKYGRDTLVESLHRTRNEIIQFLNAKQWSKPVVDSTSGLMELLNANSYQKGGWVLHMLRQQVGDAVFQNILRTYYDRYKFSNADTWAFEKVAEAISGKELKNFFRQWLYTPGIPHLNVQWRWTNGQLFITVNQKQTFTFPLTISVYEDSKKRMLHQLNLTQATQTFTLPALTKPVQVVLDPDTGLLFEGTIEERKKD